MTTPADADTVNETLTITHTAIGGDYATVTPASVAVRLRDDDTASIAISTSGLTIDEGQTARVHRQAEHRARQRRDGDHQPPATRRS